MTVKMLSSGLNAMVSACWSRDYWKVGVTAVEVCKHLGMSVEHDQKASPAEQGRFGFRGCVGVVLVFLAVVLLVKTSSSRDTVGSFILLVVGADLILPWGKQSRAVRVVSVVLAVVMLALVAVDIAVL
ncbi:hypothetical protein FHR75_004474 [Kineococcus radiotolerans]|uniref:Uncharacterized protein n=1 Tax=Kineococcus radiotolerans TaxID=131568 RepID=A0A7W4XYY7_KINRA|nr:hypothetical protein [Kineococcus radiotolerans]MBB2903631.1 hypothetical protein [Kineococcus radiotolerans]